LALIKINIGETPVDILLINPGEVRYAYVTEHLGICSLKSYVNSRGYVADTLDMAIERLTITEGITRVFQVQPAVIGVSLLEDTQVRGLSLIRKLREAGYSGYIVVGGYFATFASRQLLQDFPEIDFIVRGEGELTLAELLDQLVRHPWHAYHEILGLSYRNQGQICENPARPLIEDLDILPPPDRKYAHRVLEKGSQLRVYGTRGCWGQCTFCDIIGMYGSQPGKKWRSRSVAKLVDEIEDLVRAYRTDYFIFNDDQFLLRGDRGQVRIEEFAAELDRRHLKIRFELMCRADTIHRSTMQRLKSAGLQRVFLGLESFDDRQLQRMKKNISVHQNLKALITLYQLKIDVLASVILADAFTTLRDLINQFVTLFELRRRYFNSRQCQISVNHQIQVYPGSLVYREYRDKGLLTRDHYLKGYDYRLKFWTGLRLKLFRIEARVSQVLLKPVKTLRLIWGAVSWNFRQWVTPLHQIHQKPIT